MAPRRNMSPKTPAKRARQTSTKRRVFGVPRGVRNSESGFPKQLHMKHKFVQSISLTSAAGLTMTSDLFNCNGMFDPYVPAGGGQPLYFSQLASLYDHFYVESSVAKCTFCPRVSGNYFCAVGIDDDTTLASGNITALSCRPSAITGVASAGIKNLILKKFWNAKQAFGTDCEKRPDLSGTPAANPTETQSFVISVIGTDLTTVATIDIIVEIFYTAIWYERKEVAAT